MPTACFNQPDLRVSLSGERLQVHARTQETEELVREIPLRDLERVLTNESVRFSGPALGEILRRGIPVQFFAWNGQFLGNFLPAQNHHGLARLNQYRRTLDPEFTMRMSGLVVTAKLYNQRRVLQRLAASRSEGRESTESGDSARPSDAGDAPPGSELAATLKWLDSLFEPISRSRTLDELRGYEGTATARYFQAWAGFLPAEFPFERRSRRPPLNAVNACISFGATLLYNEMVAFLHGHGLDPALGMLHATEDGRWSLALDLVEPFRPVLVEALALDLFSHQILNSSHFESRNNGVYLNEEGRKKFFLQYERRVERQFMCEAVGHRTTLRQQLEQQAVMLKAAIEKPEHFEPFLMN